MGNKIEERVAPSPSASDPVERRSHQRVRCKGDVELRRIPPAPPESIFGRIKNISEAGSLVETERLLVVGERLAVQITLDALELRLIAEVRSVKAGPNCWAGLEFVGMSADGLAKLKALIDATVGEQPRSAASAPNTELR